jgi:hypothetical protein
MNSTSVLKNKLKEDLKLTAFIGNGINRAIPGNGIGWGNLLTNLQRINNAEHINLDNKFKPFPLSFEEIIFATFGSFDENMRTIKNNIAQAFYPAQPNLLHERIINSRKVEDIITTNYDYSFEKVLVRDFDNNGDRLPNSTTESKHSIKRRCYFETNTELSKSIWHIHGEINHNQNFTRNHYSSESIQIGYDHYGEYLNEIQNYLRGRKYANQPKIEDKLRNNIKGVSWIDKLFTDKVIILGLDLDFSEIDLWWLFNYRQKVFKRNPNLAINKIVYYQSVVAEDEVETDEDRMNREIQFKKRSAKQDVLTSLGVDFEAIPCVSYQDYYEQVFNRENI